MRRWPTSREYAGVSASTASRALNGRGELSAQTRAAVREAAEVLQFQPSLLARSLRTRTTHTVGFVVPDVASPFYAAALKGAQGALEESGYRVMLMDSGQELAGEVAALRTLLNHQVDGLLLATVGISERVFDEIVARRGTPVRLLRQHAPRCRRRLRVARQCRAGSICSSTISSAHGHSRIALLAGSLDETSGHERLDAFHSAMRRHGLDRSRASSCGCAGGRRTTGG